MNRIQYHTKENNEAQDTYLTLVKIPYNILATQGTIADDDKADSWNALQIQLTAPDNKNASSLTLFACQIPQQRAKKGLFMRGDTRKSVIYVASG